MDRALATSWHFVYKQPIQTGIRNLQHGCMHTVSALVWPHAMLCLPQLPTHQQLLDRLHACRCTQLRAQHACHATPSRWTAPAGARCHSLYGIGQPGAIGPRIASIAAHRTPVLSVRNGSLTSASCLLKTARGTLPNESTTLAASTTLLPCQENVAHVFAAREPSYK